MTSGQLQYLKWGLLLAVIASAWSVQAACPDGWTVSAHSGTCIKIYEEEETWEGARKQCEKDEADLVKIVDKGMDEFIMGQVSPKVIYWIGLRDDEDRDHVWLDESEEPEYLNWDTKTKQPNDWVEDGTKNKGDNPQGCVEIGNREVEKRTWNDQACSARNNFVCEKSLEDITAASCPSGWTKSEDSGTCIKVYEVKASWFDAREKCKDDGADLVKIVSDDMNHLIWGQIAPDDKIPKKPYWIGLHDIRSYAWLNEKVEASYTNWDDKHTNWRDGQDCAGIERENQGTSKGKWKDQRCLDTAKFICEKSQEDVDPITAACPDGWTVSAHSGTCIKIYEEEETWEGARKQCEKDEADLVKIVDKDMDEFIMGQVSPKVIYWIGLRDDEDRDHVWLDESEEPEYLNWDTKTKQPNDWVEDGTKNKGDNPQGCVEIGNREVEKRTWNDQACSARNNFVCEKSLEDITAASCPSGWTKSEDSGTCIKVYEVKASWFDAREKCKDDGADLVKIVSDDMNNLIWGQIAQDDKKPNRPYWIGLHDIRSYAWLDETVEASYTNWDDKHTNWRDGQDCAGIERENQGTSKGKWKDQRCLDTAKFICEKSQEDVDPITAACPDGWTVSAHSGTCIKIYEEEETWEGARKQCEKDEADLVKIVDKDMDEFIMGQVSPKVIYWIGLRDDEDRDHVWLDESEEPEYLKWDTKQPNDWVDGGKKNKGDNPQGCVDIGNKGVEKRTWNDQACSALNNFVCEKSLENINAASCPSGWILSEDSGTCIKVSEEKASWSDAREKCKEVGADLVKIVSDDMNNLIWDQIAPDDKIPKKPYWIGLHDIRSYAWLNEKVEASYTNWDDKHTNWRDGQDCAGIERENQETSNGKWKDQRCLDTAKFICEKSQEDVDPITGKIDEGKVEETAAPDDHGTPVEKPEGGETAKTDDGGTPGEKPEGGETAAPGDDGTPVEKPEGGETAAPGDDGTPVEKPEGGETAKTDDDGTPVEKPEGGETAAPGDDGTPVEKPEGGETAAPGDDGTPVEKPEGGETAAPGDDGTPVEKPEGGETAAPGDDGTPVEKPEGGETAAPGDDGTPVEKPEGGETAAPGDDGTPVGKPEGEETAAPGDDGTPVEKPEGGETGAPDDDGTPVEKPEGGETAETDDDGTQVEKPEGGETAETDDDGTPVEKPEGGETAAPDDDGTPVEKPEGGEKPQPAEGQAPAENPQEKEETQSADDQPPAVVGDDARPPKKVDPGDEKSKKSAGIEQSPEDQDQTDIKTQDSKGLNVGGTAAILTVAVILGLILLIVLILGTRCYLADRAESQMSTYKKYSNSPYDSHGHIV